MNSNLGPTQDVTVLVCMCGKTVQGDGGSGPSWERMANVAEAHGWTPVVKGEAVGMSTGTHFYACCPSHRDEWLKSL